MSDTRKDQRAHRRKALKRGTGRAEQAKREKRRKKSHERRKVQGYRP